MLHRVRAIIIDNNKLLTIKRVKTDSTYFVFPGGGVESGEKLEDALRRECREELGVEVEIINEFVSERFDKGDTEQLEHFYICDIVSGELGTGDGSEFGAGSNYKGTYGIEWLDVNDLINYDLRPKEVVVKMIDSLNIMEDSLL